MSKATDRVRLAACGLAAALAAGPVVGCGRAGPAAKQAVPIVKKVGAAVGLGAAAEAGRDGYKVAKDRVSKPAGK